MNLAFKEKDNKGNIIFEGKNEMGEKLEIKLENMGDNMGRKDRPFNQVAPEQWKVTEMNGETLSGERYTVLNLVDDKGRIERTGLLRKSDGVKRIRIYYYDDPLKGKTGTNQQESNEGIIRYNDYWISDTISNIPPFEPKQGEYYRYDSEVGAFIGEKAIPQTGIAEFDLVDRIQRICKQIETAYKSGVTKIECEDILFGMKRRNVFKINDINVVPMGNLRDLSNRIGENYGKLQILLPLLPSTRTLISFPLIKNTTIIHDGKNVEFRAYDANGQALDMVKYDEKLIATHYTIEGQEEQWDIKGILEKYPYEVPDKKKAKPGHSDPNDPVL